MAKVCRITIKDEVYSNISGLSDADFEFLYGKMAKLVEGAKFMPLVRAGIWDGKIPFLSKEGEIYTRLLDLVAPYIENWGYEIDFNDKRYAVKLVETRIDKDWFVRKEGMPFKMELRPYQISAINACLENQSGFILAATGAGKCLHGDTPIRVATPIYEQIPRPEPRYTERVQTYEQLFQQWEKAGLVFEINKPVDVSHYGMLFPSPEGHAPIIAAIKKEDTLFEVTLCHINTGRYNKVKCAAGHLFIHTNGNPTAARDLKPGSLISGRDGVFEVCSVVNMGVSDIFYDVSIDNVSHTYYDASGVLHHNTWMVAGLTDILAQNDIRSIVIVPSDDLVKQTVETLRQGLVDVGTYSGASKDIHHSVVVATWQALQNNPTLVREFQCLICDEAHGAKAKVVGELINKAGGRIAYRFGFTGTMPKPEIDRLTLQGSIGEVLFSITAAELIEMGYLSELEITPIETNEGLGEDFPDYASEKAFLSKCEARMDFLADYMIAKTEEHGNTLVLVNSVKQGKALQALIKDSVFLHGADDSATRSMWYNTFENRDDLIVIATFGIASTGISIDRIAHLALIDAGKSFTRSIQSIGRGLRKGRGKSYVHVSEIYSSLKWSKKHAKLRMSYYKEAQYKTNKIEKVKV